MNKYEVQLFLDDFKIKMQIMGITFLDDRLKNSKTLTILEIAPARRKQILQDLTVEDYSEGPIEEIVFMGSPLWVFGKIFKGYEIYIKISMGKPNNNTLCISFHIAEFPMNYPFKQST
jgi:hypothetical protein